MFEDLQQWWHEFTMSDEDKEEINYLIYKDGFDEGFEAGSDWQSSQDN